VNDSVFPVTLRTALAMLFNVLDCITYDEYAMNLAPF